MVSSENGIILAIGGLSLSGDDVNDKNLVDELDLKSESKRWVSTRPLNQPRQTFAVCTYKQNIYVVGGKDLTSNRFLYSVEYYNTNSKVWTKITEPMPTARESCSATIFNNKLYVFGGCNDRGPLATVEYYDFEKKHWKQLDPMPIRNYNMIILRKENVIYLIGGDEEFRFFKFDLQYFKWDEMPNMNKECESYYSSIVIMRNDFFEFKNIGGELTCEKYDRVINQWQLVDKAGDLISQTENIITFNDITLKSYGIQL
ncbi:kelch-like protein 2 [Adelges cooleyi]|uniref:kelch-like protein 2 n=1 Tax=Adelges cooleyi TaxID=133065 RepID=UPI00217F2849|nr:kelch-like protein 2 [Adelges cooleyi]